MVLIKWGITKTLVKEYFPDIDFSKPITTKEWRRIKKIIREGEERRLRVAKAKATKTVLKREEKK